MVGDIHASLAMHQILTLAAADTVVKVPQMAESITEGTLKQWSKRELSLSPSAMFGTDTA